MKTYYHCPTDKEFRVLERKSGANRLTALYRYQLNGNKTKNAYRGIEDFFNLNDIKVMGAKIITKQKAERILQCKL